MNIPNILTVSRIVMAAFLGLALLLPGIQGALLAIAIFLLASFTDFFDGYLARKYNLITTFGKIMDPIADKVLILTALFLFAYQGIIPMGLALLIAFREIVVTAFRVHILLRGKALPAEQAGKVKMVFQVGAVGAILLYRFFELWAPTAAAVVRIDTALHCVLIGFVIGATALTLWSGYSFFRNLAAQEA